MLLGDCDIQMEADFLRREAARRGIDLHVSATFPDDIGLSGERKHDAVFIGALRARHLVAEDLADGLNPHAAYIAYHRASDAIARSDLRADPDRQSARADGAAAGPRGTRREGTPHPVPADQCGAGRTRERLFRCLCDRCRGRAGGGRLRTAARRRAGGLHPFRLAGMDAAAAGKRKGRRPRHLSGYRRRWRRRWAAIPMAARR
jgi:hypothetical protein